jgi:SAM-dependent methyltransferase
MALRDRKQLARLIAYIARRALAAVGEPKESTQPESIPITKPASQAQPEPPPGPEPGAPAHFERELDPGSLAGYQLGASRALYERLTTENVAEIESLIAQDTGLKALYDERPDLPARRYMTLAFGAWLDVSAMREMEGISIAEPPAEIHVMARGPLAAAGGLYEADLVHDALANVGVKLTEIEKALDFGCSSGRVIRVLASLYPQAKWHGCDPNAPAIEWATEHLPSIRFFVSRNEPPLQLEDCSLDMAYAISIWSHFAPDLGLRWFDEMHRLVRPGGHLVITTHGLTSIAHYAALSLRAPQQSDEILDSLYREGWWYAAEFGEEGDWGVINPEWGTAFLSPEWILTQLCPRWRVLEFVPGLNQGNQDLYVLQRA